MSRREYLRNYQRVWIAKRRAEWFREKYCTRCSSTTHLEIHHVEPENKVDHKVWSWSRERQAVELAKCVVLCRSCHDEVTAEMVMPEHGTASRYHHKKSPCRCELCKEARKLEGRRSRSLKFAGF